MFGPAWLDMKLLATSQNWALSRVSPWPVTVSTWLWASSTRTQRLLEWAAILKASLSWTWRRISGCLSRQSTTKIKISSAMCISIEIRIRSWRNTAKSQAWTSFLPSLTLISVATLLARSSCKLHRRRTRMSPIRLLHQESSRLQLTIYLSQSITRSTRPLQVPTSMEIGDLLCAVFLYSQTH